MSIWALWQKEIDLDWKEIEKWWIMGIWALWQKEIDLEIEK